MRARGGVAGCLAALLIAVAGCNERELKAASQAEEFASDVARGKGGDWKLASGADAAAHSVWFDRSRIQALGKRLEKAPAWACETAERVHTSSEVLLSLEPPHQKLDPPQRTAIVQEEQQHGADPQETELVIDESLELWKDELEGVVRACSAAKQL